jgi:aspartyl/asparaginyl beta-hydroxylase (cupin superfamily)
MFYDPKDFAFTTPLEENWERIRDEFLAVREELIEYVERDLYDNSWKTFMMYSFPHGEPMPENLAKCPFTSRLVHEIEPSHGVITFSILQPKTTIKPHGGYKADFLRCHLGLIIPDGDAALRVGNTTRKWETGKVMVFDDRVEHSAWNLTDKQRSVLLFDFIPDPAVYKTAPQGAKA